MSPTIVAFHAHPDDEALLTAGTMARAAAEGHRVVLVLATDGGAGLAAAELRRDGGLGERRLEEARRSAASLGVARVEWLGYADSGSGAEPEPDAPGATRFCRAPLEEAAERLAAVLRTERADLLLSYDANGGYGHRDHVRVHEVGARAAEIARHAAGARGHRAPRHHRAGRSRARPGLPLPRTSSTRRRSSGPSRPAPRSPTGSNVRRYAGAKRAAMRAHASQATGGGAASAGAGGADRRPHPGGLPARSPDPSTISCSGGSGSATRPSRRAHPVRTDIFEGER